MVSAGMSTEYLITCRRKKVAPWSDWNRYFVYRLFKKYNIGIQLAGREKKSVTHAIRHSVAKSIKNNGFTIENSKQVLGHNSLKGTSYYHE